MNQTNLFDAWIHVLDPMRAEVRLRLHKPAGELRGRLMGPRSHFTTTIEIAYPFRSLSSPGEFAAIVPVPSLWSPAKPFIYEGPVERIDPNGTTEQAWLRICMRSLNLGSGGLVLNGKSLQLRGKELVEDADENALIELRRQGFNALLPTTGQADLNGLADRLGFLLIHRPSQGDSGKEIFSVRLDDTVEIRLPDEFACGLAASAKPQAGIL
jgi:hypothetical protein